MTALPPSDSQHKGSENIAASIKQDCFQAPAFPADACVDAGQRSPVSGCVYTGNDEGGGCTCLTWLT